MGENSTLAAEEASRFRRLHEGKVTIKLFLTHREAAHYLQKQKGRAGSSFVCWNILTSVFGIDGETYQSLLPHPSDIWAIWLKGGNPLRSCTIFAVTLDLNHDIIPSVFMYFLGK